MVPDFIHIGPRASLYTPPQPVDGQLVIICTWLGAKGKHIAKYTSLYQRIAPGARILLVESNVPILVSSYARQRSDIQPAASAVLDTLAECGHHDGRNDIGSHKEREATSASERPTSRDTNSMPTPPTPPPSTTSSSSSSTASLRPTTTAIAGRNTLPPKLVLHSFSNGGSNTATQLLIVLRQRLHHPLPLAGLILDSCPAKGTYWKSYKAMVLSLPPDAASQLLGALAVHFLLTLLYAWIACGNENPAGLMRRTLLDGRTVGGARRVCYLYSTADAMVEWGDVRDHASEARRVGWGVVEEVFDQSAHCAHMSVYEDRYVRAVEGIWTGCGGDDEKVGMGSTRTRTKL